ncbi:hypothetical protein [Nonlabens sp. Asnod3-A02]|uniref:hypothetical protein n=1 Tax=Nonlabens sp. Asnod3-A02 TaxID=3160579 RepID=UPI00386DE08A
MKKLILLLSIILLASCTQEVEPTIENMNSIFESKDFTIEYHLTDARVESMSFIEDILVYKANDSVVRKTISFDEALLINQLIQEKFKQHDSNNNETPSIIVLNTAKKVTLKIPNYEVDYLNLINKLDL